MASRVVPPRKRRQGKNQGRPLARHLGKNREDLPAGRRSPAHLVTFPVASRHRHG
jgi:hypothetical protein